MTMRMAVCRQSLMQHWCRSPSLTGMWTHYCSPGGPAQGASPLTPIGVLLKPLRRLQGKERPCPSSSSGGQTSALRTISWGNLSLTFPF